MKAGQKFYVACAGVSSWPYAFVHEYECVSTTCGLVIYKEPWMDHPGSIAESDTYATKEAARAACIQKLHAIRSRITEDIDAEIQKVEARS